MEDIIKEKMDFIDATRDAIDAVVEPILDERMKLYHEQFESFSRLDARLWGSLDIAFIVSYASSIEMDAEED